MKKYLVLLPIAIAVFALSFKGLPVNEEVKPERIKWMTWEEVQKAQQKEKRKVVVDVYTDWCGWCKRMDAGTFSHPEIINYVNKNFYAVKFNAETTETISFKGKDYNYVSTATGQRGYNELAAEILRGRLSYPTLVYMDENLDLIWPVPGYQDPKKFEAVINFVASNSFKTIHWEEYESSFQGKVM